MGAQIIIKKVTGRHVYGELYDCDADVLMDEEYLVNVVKSAVEIGGFTLLDVKVWKIWPGVSVIAIILESHIAIHTWPEHRFATVDVYTCGSKGDPFKAFNYIVEKLRAKRYTVKFASRDYEEPV
ncbi:MAG: adenosylmethionine decarboxylase [Desulfurococcaceae archaeon]|jgi:S-adenosylmethionine decarboxylase|nr:adenosylmethionine decarboxylase [Desulfurococcaceae archaeon]